MERQKPRRAAGICDTGPGEGNKGWQLELNGQRVQLKGESQLSESPVMIRVVEG